MIAGEQSDERYDAHYSNYYRSLTYAGAEIRKPQKVGVAKKNYASRNGKLSLSHVRIVSNSLPMIFKPNWGM